MKVFKINTEATFIALTLVGFELISFIPTVFGLDSQLISIPYRALYLLIIVTLFIKQRRLPLDKMPVNFVPVLFFWIIYIIKALSDLAFNYGEFYALSGNFFLFSFGLCFIPMLPMLLKFGKNEIALARKVTFVFTLIINVWSLANNLSGFSTETTSRFLGNEILNPISYGHTGVVLVLLCMTYFNNANYITKLLFIGLIFMGIANIALAASRTPVMELLVCLLFMLIVNFKKIRIEHIIFILLGFGVLTYYLWDYFFVFNTLFDRLESTGLNSDSGNVERVDLFKDAISKAIEHPIFGYHAINSYPHNLILEGFMALGVLGGLLMTYIFIVTTKMTVKLIRNPNVNWLALIFLTQIVSSMMSGAIWNNMIFWPLLALIINLNNKQLEN